MNPKDWKHYVTAIHAFPWRCSTCRRVREAIAQAKGLR